MGVNQPKSQMIVRRNTRYDVSIRAAMSVSEQHAGSVRFGPSAGGKDGWVECDCVDLSMGGLGLLTTVFVPRPTVVRVRLFNSSEACALVLECECVVRRVLMTDRRPAYHLGCSFGTLSDEQLRQVEALIASVATEVA